MKKRELQKLLEAEQRVNAQFVKAIDLGGRQITDLNLRLGATEAKCQQLEEAVRQLSDFKIRLMHENEELRVQNQRLTQRLVFQSENPARGPRER